MSEVDPYAPPRAALADPAPPEAPPKSGPGRRFLARVADNLLLAFVMIAVLLLATQALGFAMDEEDVLVTVCGLIALALLGPVQIFFLVRDGQTIAKKLLDLRIVRPDGSRPNPWRLVLLREVAPSAISAIPIAGPLFSLVDALFIFRSDTRCVHDHMGDTIVIDLRQAKEASLRLGSLRAE